MEELIKAIPLKPYFNKLQASKLLNIDRRILEKEINAGRIQTIIVAEKPKVSRSALIEYLNHF